MDEALEKIAIKEDFLSQLKELSEHVASKIYTSSKDKLLNKHDWAPMESSVTSYWNLYMLFFETDDIQLSKLKSNFWIYYIDDIFIWSHELKMSISIWIVNTRFSSYYK